MNRVLSVAILALSAQAANAQCDSIEYVEARDMPKDQLIATICFNRAEYDRLQSIGARQGAEVCYNSMSKVRNVLYNVRGLSVDELNKQLQKSCPAPR